MTRLLRIVDYWYGEETRQRIFEPLLADFANELRARPSIPTRLRWGIAIASTLLACVPRAAFGTLPLALIKDLTIRGVAFGALAVAMQWLAAGIGRHPVAVPLSFVTTVPFIVLPVVWRIRLADVSIAQRRSLACVIAVAAAAMSFSLSGEAWYLRLAFALMPVIIAAIGWRLGDPEYLDHPSVTDRKWLLTFLVINSFNICAFPASLFLKATITDFWPKGMVVTMPIGIVMYLSMRSILHRSHS